MDRILNAVAANFEGEEMLRQIIINRTPFFGNDEEYADNLSVQVYNDLLKAIDGKPNVKGESFHLNMLSTTCHIYFGKVLGQHPMADLPENLSLMEHPLRMDVMLMVLQQ